MNLKVPIAVATFLLIAVPTVGSTAPDRPVVEGHTTYAEIIVGDEAVATLDLIGDVRCHVEVLGVRVDVPPSVDRVGLDCGSDLAIYVTPQGAPDPTTAVLSPTGSAYTTTGPQGTSWVTTEHTYEEDDGTEHRTWTVPVQGPYVDPATGGTYRFVAPVPSDATASGSDLQVRSGPLP